MALNSITAPAGAEQAATQDVASVIDKPVCYHGDSMDMPPTTPTGGNTINEPKVDIAARFFTSSAEQEAIRHGIAFNRIEAKYVKTFPKTRYCLPEAVFLTVYSAFNSVARMYNITVTEAWHDISPLVSTSNRQIEGFPSNLLDMDSLSGECLSYGLESRLLTQSQEYMVNQILRDLEQLTTGDLTARRQRLQQACGICFRHVYP